MNTISVPSPLVEEQVMYPSSRTVQVFSPNPVTGGVSQATFTTAGGFVVYTAEDARRCELAGVEFVYINPALALAISVERSPAGIPPAFLVEELPEPPEDDC